MVIDFPLMQRRASFDLLRQIIRGKKVDEFAQLPVKYDWSKRLVVLLVNRCSGTIDCFEMTAAIRPGDDACQSSRAPQVQVR
jgi:hypothetical protein